MRQLFASDIVRVADWRCPGHDQGERAEWGEGHAVVVTRRGAFVREVEGERFFLDAASAAFWHPDEEYRVRHPVPGGDHCSVFELPPGAAAALVGRSLDASDAEPRRARFPRRQAPLDGPAYLLHARAFRLAADAEAGALAVEEAAVAFLHAAVAAARDGAPAGQPPTRQAAEYAARVRALLARRWAEPLSLGDIARAVGCSPFHLSRLVAAREGITIHQLRLKLRLRAALERLLDTREDVAAIAFAVGFASHSHLGDAFRREFGTTPSAVRRLAARAPRRLPRAPDR
ncbi:MAG TPA: AraC family transcriptional regulator [Gemmatimonadaceae bacterium]|nr:AraC family transcriptional regulator [Gemmatimonadaceae bacterium]